MFTLLWEIETRNPYIMTKSRDIFSGLGDDRQSTNLNTEVVLLEMNNYTTDAKYETAVCDQQSLDGNGDNLSDQDIANLSMSENNVAREKLARWQDLWTESEAFAKQIEKAQNICRSWQDIKV
jgi:hypothetical protein